MKNAGCPDCEGLGVLWEYGTGFGCVECDATGVIVAYWDEVSNRVRGGADVDAIAEEYGITVDQVRAAVEAS